MKKREINLKEMFEALKDGIIPSDIKEKTVLVNSLEHIGRLAPIFSAQIIATARSENFNDDEPSWAQWVTDSFEFSKEHRCHLNLVGKMLIGMKEKYPEYYEILISLAFDCNLPIAQLYRDMGAHDTQRFLAANVQGMTREEIRDAVDLCLSPKGQKRPPEKNTAIQPELPGLIESIDVICSYDPDEIKKLSRNPKFADANAGKAIVIGVELLAAGIDQHENKNLSLQASPEFIEVLKEKAYKAYKKLEFWSVKSETFKNAG